MQSTEQILRLQINYHEWAIAEMWESLAPAPQDIFTRPSETSFGSLAGTLEHMFRVDRIWLARLNSEAALKMSEVTVPPNRIELRAAWKERLRELADAVAHADIHSNRIFTNSQSIRFDIPVWQIVLHVVNHGTAHRGLVSGILRQFGVTPRSTDLVQYYRLAAATSGSVNE